MNLNTLAKLIGDGRMASVDFTRKDGVRRTINGRVGVRKYLKGGKSKNANPKAKGQLIVWETLRPQDKDRDGTKRYRTIQADRVLAVRTDKVEITAR